MQFWLSIVNSLCNFSFWASPFLLLWHLDTGKHPFHHCLAWPPCFYHRQAWPCFLSGLALHHCQSWPCITPSLYSCVSHWRHISRGGSILERNLFSAGLETIETLCDHHRLWAAPNLSKVFATITSIKGPLPSTWKCWLMVGVGISSILAASASTRHQMLVKMHVEAPAQGQW